jgi:hypothetical protein
MELFPSDKIRAKFKSAKWPALALLVGWFLWEALLHAIFSWFNEHMAKWLGHMNVFGTIIKWTGDNPILFLISLGVSYCLFVIIGAQITPFHWPWGMIPLKEAAQNLYDKLITSNMADNFTHLFVNPAESHNEVLNSLGDFLANENISIYGKPRHSTKMIEIKNLQQKLGDMEFRDGATCLCFLHKSEAFTDLHIKKNDAIKASGRVMDKMPDLLTEGESSIAVVEKQVPLNIRSLLIDQPYTLGTILGGIKWTPDFRDLRVIFDNSTDYDYIDIDFTIPPDFPNITIVAIGQISNLPNVTFHNPVMQAYLRPNGTPEFKFDKQTGHTLGDDFKFVAPGPEGGLTPLRVYPNHYRIRCEKLPHHMILEIALAIPKENIAKQSSKINKVWLKGRYYEGSSIHNIDQTVSVSN